MAAEALHDVIERMSSIQDAYESSAEECLGERIRATVLPSVLFETQSWANTKVGRFRLDFLLINESGRRLAIEVDGQAYHNSDRDFWRSVMILGEGHVDVIYRFPTFYLREYMTSLLACLASRERGFFKREATIQWSDTVQRTTRASAVMTWCGKASLDKTQASWQPYFAFANQSGLHNMDAIRRQWKIHNESAIDS